MGMMNLQQALDWIRAADPTARLVGDGSVVATRVHTDTRSVQPADLFVALKGEQFDANTLLPQARAQGAVAAVAHGGLAEAGLPGIEVADTRRALGALAAGWRQQFTLPLVAVTGSNGKTTVTQMVAAILQAAAPGHALATQGNLNNDIGVPQTLLRMAAHHRLGVVELGMNHPGEIAYLADLVRPTVALVNNAQREHLEFMHTVDAVATENGAVLAALPPNGVAVFPADSPYTAFWRQQAAGRQRLLFGVGGDVRVVQAIWQGHTWDVHAATPVGDLRYTLHIAGQHNVVNSLAAATCALAAGVPLAAIANGLAGFAPVKGRSRALVVPVQGRTVTVVDDTYNANPDSMRAAIEVLAALPAPRLLVVGDMGEVGDQGPAFHREAGEHARAAAIDKLLTLGEQSRQVAAGFGDADAYCPDIDTLNARVLALLPVAGSVLVKGSRFMKMERVVAAIEAAGTPQPPTTRQEGSTMAVAEKTTAGGATC